MSLAFAYRVASLQFSGKGARAHCARYDSAGHDDAIGAYVRLGGVNSG